MAKTPDTYSPRPVCSATFIAWSAFRNSVLAGLGGLLAIVWAGSAVKTGIQRDVASISSRQISTEQRMDKLEYTYAAKSDSLIAMMTRMNALVEMQNRQLRIFNTNRPDR